MINNNWIFGNNAGLDFSSATTTNPPTPTAGNAINTREGCASISDSSGNLLFYTDGRTVWDSVHIVRVTGLLGNSSSTQSAIIVPDPGNNKQYYVFTADANGSNNHFNGVLINVTSWVSTPLSSIMALPSTSGLSPAEKITAIQHENCKDFWVVSILQKGTLGTRNGLGIIRVFLVDSLGVHHDSDTFLNKNIDDIGYLKASPNGHNLAIANYQGNYEILIYPFNNSTGVINTGGLQTIPTMANESYGIEFSPNSKLLYYSDLRNGPVFQVDFTNTLTSNVVGNITSNTGAFQLGPDNRIYITEYGQNTLGAILNPNILGSGCNVNPSYISLASGSISLWGLPNLISSFCDEECDCGCTGCNENSEKQNEELIDRAKLKHHTITSNTNCDKPFIENCEKSAITSQINFEPCFYFHWGDGANDQIEEHDTEVFYLTICNSFNDITYNGLRITKVTLTPNIHPLDKIQIVPDRFISLDCLEPCTCQTREFTMITRANDTAGNYTLEVEYCYEEIVITSSGNSGVVKFPVVITED